MSKTWTQTFLSVTLVLSACASATDRLQEGMEAEAYGRWYRAADRYIEALEKDAQLKDARDRLLEVGDSALSESLRSAAAGTQAGNAVEAGREYRRMDNLLSRARSVGVRIPAPSDYGDTRRATFDAAITELMEAGEAALQRGQWDVGRRSLVQARADFEASPLQRHESFVAESHLLLNWAWAEEEVSRFRHAFGLAEEAMAAATEGRAGAVEEHDRREAEEMENVIREATELQDRVVEVGTLGMAVFPITILPELESVGETDTARLLSDILELDYWRDPPLFVAVSDPVLVRTVTRRLIPRGVPLRPEWIMETLGAEFGVLVELVDFQATEEDLRRRTHNTRTNRGLATTFVEEEGTLRYEIHAQVLIVDRAGRDLEDVVVTRQEAGPFQRGIYEGNPGILDLSRSQRRLFDPVLQARQRAEIEETLLAQLAGEIADRVFRSVLDRIP